MYGYSQDEVEMREIKTIATPPSTIAQEKYGRNSSCHKMLSVRGNKEKGRQRSRSGARSWRSMSARTIEFGWPRPHTHKHWSWRIAELAELGHIPLLYREEFK